jgi:diguanylate cyclase (GGDEF)-like protein
MEQRLNTLAHYDTLTGLPNRVLFQDRLAQVLAQARRDQRLVGLLYLDLDRFKVVNDTLGHTIGDQLLKAVAQRLVGAVRASNAVSRLGGDEFTVILPGLTTPEGASVVARKILRLFSEPISVRGHEVFVTSSIGITIYPTDGDEIEALLRSADTAMYRAKERGNTYQFYASDMHSRTVDRLTLENSLRRAVEQREFVVFYQPLVGLETGRVVGLEALVRWRRPGEEVVAPGDFIPLAEETGLIIPIGAWVLREACAQARAWQQAGFPPVRVSVNLSSAQVMHVDLPEMVTRALSDSGLDPRSLDLELTESIFMRDAETTTAALNRLHAIGVTFSIDDFGTGYSSLGYLRRFPIGALKIGRGFMRDVPASADDAAIVTTIIAMAHSLGMRVVAEGIERDEQLAFLRTQGCDVIQGALVSPAVPVEAVTPFLRPQWRLTVAQYLDKTA